MSDYFIYPALILQSINQFTQLLNELGVAKENLIVMMLIYIIYLLIKTINNKKND